MDPDSSPAQSGQEHRDEADAISDDDAADVGLDDEVSHGISGSGASAGGPSGSDQLQPGPSHQQSGLGSTFQEGTDSDIDDVDQQPGPSSASVVAASSGLDRGVSCASAGAATPDDGSNSDEFWAASSTESRNEENKSNNSSAATASVAASAAVATPDDRGINEQPSESGAARASVVSVASFSPQPSSSSSNPGASNNSSGFRPSQSSSAAQPPSLLAVSSAGPSSSASALSSTSSPNQNHQARGGVTSSSAVNSDLVRSGSLLPVAMESPSASHRPPSPLPGPSGLQLHGEISNPPSPLGGSRPSALPSSESRGLKRDFPDSPLTTTSSNVKRHRSSEEQQQPIPGPSGIGMYAGSSSGGVNGSSAAQGSEAAAACASVEAGAAAAAAAAALMIGAVAPDSPPMTPADNFMISSSTGLIDSVPPTPVDIHGDNDLSVPSPVPAGVGGAGGSVSGGGGVPRPRPPPSSEIDDMIDSTVDSTGLSRVPGLEYMEGSEFCQSSRYLDSSDDEGEDSENATVAATAGTAEVSRSPPLVNPQANNDENISTSGQVDEGQFRLVPNDPEDDFFNQKHPPLRPNGQVAAAPSAYQPYQGNSKDWKGKSKSSSAKRLQIDNNLSKSSGDQGCSNSLPLSLECFGQNPYGEGTSSSGLVSNRRPSSAAVASSKCEESNGLESLLPCPDLVGPQLSSSFASIGGEDVDGSGGDDGAFGGQPVDLEDIQLQKFGPEQPAAAPKPNENGSSDGSSSAQAEQHHNSIASLEMPDLSLVKPEAGEGCSGVEQQDSRPNGLDLVLPASTSRDHRSSQQQHSSILESMTGPLSKRLRTLHSMQQKAAAEEESKSGSSEALARPQQPNPQPLVKSNQQQQEQSPTIAPDSLPEQQQHLTLPSSSDQQRDQQQQDSSDNSNQSNNNESCFFPTNHQAFSVLIDPVVVDEPVLGKSPEEDDTLWRDRECKSVVTELRPRRAVSKPANNAYHQHDPLTMQITDAPVQSRARASLPSSHLSVRQVKDPEGRLQDGVFARRKIPKGCRFGPLEGTPQEKTEGAQLKKEEGFKFIVLTNGVATVIDTTDDDTSNWMKYVRPATTPLESNVSLTQDGDQLFFITSRNICPRQELRVSYSPQYAAERNLPVPDVLEEEEDESLWPCFECTKKLQSSEELQSHLSEHDKELEQQPPRKQVKVLLPEKSDRKKHQRNAFCCPLCPRQFTRELSLSRHVELHKDCGGPEQPRRHLCCKECPARFSHPMTLARHSRRAHDRDPEGRYSRCPTCRLWFPSPSLYNVHLFSHHPEKSNQDLTGEEAQSYQPAAATTVESGDGIKFRCLECFCQFESWLALVGHVSVHGLSKLAVEDGEDGKSDATWKKSSRSQFKCELCYKSFSTEERLERHMLVHGTDDEDKPLACDSCGKRFLSKSALACHAKIHCANTHTAANATYDCPICGTVFEQIVSLKEHVHEHCINGLYECPRCHKEFSEYSLVRKHIRAIHGERRHLCSTCSKSFASADKLKIHVVVHSNVKEFTCNDCGKQFKRKDKLREHVQRMHTDTTKNSDKQEDQYETPPEEQHNGEASTGKAKFIPKVSPNDYHRFIYKCHECLLGFKRRGMLVNHLAKRHPDISPDTVPELNLPILKATKDYYCQYCSKIYKSSSKRKAHILKNHPGRDLPLPARLQVDPEGVGVGGGTFSATVGSVTTEPHSCPHCHKQYASNAKLLQHLRKKHRDQLPVDKRIPRRNGSKRSGGGGSRRSRLQPPPIDLDEPFVSASDDQFVAVEEVLALDAAAAAAANGGGEARLVPLPPEEAMRLASSSAIIRVEQQEQEQPAGDAARFENMDQQLLTLEASRIIAIHQLPVPPPSQPKPTSESSLGKTKSSTSSMGSAV